MEQLPGQMSIYDFVPDPEEVEPLREPCKRHCAVEWGSLKCFLMRGYVRDRSTEKWARGSDGKILRIKNRECDWKCSDEIDFSCFSSWKNPENKNGVIVGKCPYNSKLKMQQPRKKCEECEAHIRFYQIAEAHRELNKCTWSEAISWTKAKLGIEDYYAKVPSE